MDYFFPGDTPLLPVDFRRRFTHFFMLLYINVKNSVKNVNFTKTIYIINYIYLNGCFYCILSNIKRYFLKSSTRSKGVSPQLTGSFQNLIHYEKSLKYNIFFERCTLKTEIKKIKPKSKN
jgi:hypothetical protein